MNVLLTMLSTLELIIYLLVKKIFNFINFKIKTLLRKRKNALDLEPGMMVRASKTLYNVYIDSALDHKHLSDDLWSIRKSRWHPEDPIVTFESGSIYTIVSIIDQPDECSDHTKTYVVLDENCKLLRFRYSALANFTTKIKFIDELFVPMKEQSIEENQLSKNQELT